MCLIGFLFLLTTHLGAQESEIIYSGLSAGSSIYATQDHLFVVESGKHRLLKLDHDGNLIETLGGIGSGDYQFDEPVDVDATNGLKIYVSDYGNNRVQIFDRRFQYLGSITGDSFLMKSRIKPTRLVVNDFGELFVYDEDSESILKFDENGNYVDGFELGTLYPTDMEIIRDRIQVKDHFSGQMLMMTQNGLVGELFPVVQEFEDLMDECIIANYRYLLFLNRIEKVEVKH